MLQSTFSRSLIPAVIVLAILATAGPSPSRADESPLRPSEANPYYWQYQGKPVLLLGGTWQDNLFNHPIGLERHLDLLKSAGGNYVRNVMSHRNQGNVFAFAQTDGKFDLDRWNDEYWQRLENFLKLARVRDIIVQIEVWATWDHYENHQSIGGWSKHPFNPANNVTYTPEESRLPTSVNYAPRGNPTEHAFFRTVPALDDNRVVLRYQQAFVDKLLSISLDFPNVLYCMNNETGEHVAWGDYWADHVHRRAAEAGRTVYVTDMRRNEDVRAPDHRHIYDNPKRYNFLDISQNSPQAGQTHYDRFLFVREYIAERPRPINTTKIYNIRGGDEESVARFFRLIFGGGAAARFHRPHPLEGTGDHERSTEWGLGLSPRAQTTLRSARMLADAMNLFACEPRNDLLGDREPNEAYCLAEVRNLQYAVYFTDGGRVRLDLSAAPGPLTARWIDIQKAAWTGEAGLRGGGHVELSPPGKGHWAVLIVPGS
jgi:hypothetical protein